MSERICDECGNHGEVTYESVRDTNRRIVIPCHTCLLGTPDLRRAMKDFAECDARMFWRGSKIREDAVRRMYAELVKLLGAPVLDIPGLTPGNNEL